VAVLPAVVLVVRQRVVLPEERYLTVRFGDTCTDYARRVRRWL